MYLIDVILYTFSFISVWKCVLCYNLYTNFKIFHARAPTIYLLYTKLEAFSSVAELFNLTAALRMH